jgi:hypothetical protein
MIIRNEEIDTAREELKMETLERGLERTEHFYMGLRAGMEEQLVSLYRTGMSAMAMVAPELKEVPYEDPLWTAFRGMLLYMLLIGVKVGRAQATTELTKVEE